MLWPHSMSWDRFTLPNMVSTTLNKIHPEGLIYSGVCLIPVEEHFSSTTIQATKQSKYKLWGMTLGFTIECLKIPGLWLLDFLLQSEFYQVWIYLEAFMLRKERLMNYVFPNSKL